MRPVRLAPRLDVPAQPAVRAIEPMLGHQPAEHPFDRMPPLTRHHPVHLQPLVDHMLERIRLAPEPPILRGLRGTILLPCLLGDRATVHTKLTRDLHVRHILTVMSSNILRNRHVPSSRARPAATGRDNDPCRTLTREHPLNGLLVTAAALRLHCCSRNLPARSLCSIAYFITCGLLSHSRVQLLRTIPTPYQLKILGKRYSSTSSHKT